MGAKQKQRASLTKSWKWAFWQPLPRCADPPCLDQAHDTSRGADQLSSLQEEKTVIMMALDYAQWAFQSLESAKDANWEFTSPEAADQELLHHRDELAPVAIHLFVQCRWSAMTVAHANLMYNAIQSYRPATRLKFTMQQMWDGIAFVRNVYRTLSTNQAYSFEAFQHLVKQPAILPAMVSQYGLSAQQFDKLMAHLIQTGNEDLRWATCLI